MSQEATFLLVTKMIRHVFAKDLIRGASGGFFLVHIHHHDSIHNSIITRISYLATGPTCKRFFFSEGLRRKSTAAGEETEEPLMRGKYWKDPSKGGVFIVTFFTLLAFGSAIYYCTDVTKQVYWRDYDFPAFKKKSPVEDNKDK